MLTPRMRNFNLKQLGMKYISLLILSLFISSCRLNGMEEWQASLPAGITTKNEIAYADGLMKEGYKNIKFDIPIGGTVGYGTSTYLIEMLSPFPLTESNKDSVLLINQKIASELLNNIMEDSTKQEVSLVCVTFILQNDIVKTKNLYRYSKCHSKEDLIIGKIKCKYKNLYFG